MNFSALCEILVRFSSVTPEFTLLKKTTFSAIWQKSAYHAKYSEYPEPKFTYLTSLVGIWVGIIILTFVRQSPKVHCHGNQLNLGAVHG